MTIRTLPPWDIHEPPPVPVWRFTVEEYQQMGKVGVLMEDDRVELLEGWIVPKRTHFLPRCSSWANTLFPTAASSGRNKTASQ